MKVMDLKHALHTLMRYAREQGLYVAADEYTVRHQLMHILQLDAWPDAVVADPVPLGQIQPVLDALVADAFTRGVIPNDGVTQRDLLDTAIMGCFVAAPSVIQAEFAQNYHRSPQAATQYFYQQSRASNYIRMARTAKNNCWKHRCAYGELDITINLSKPEKDPKAIIAAGQAKSASYPKCLLCRENEGYAGRVDHPARQNLRLIPLTLNNEQWFLQYSPYEYYNEHCIVLKAEHEPMKLTRATFVRLLDFVAQFPHYFLGSNADLPIVGGSILSHDHFQGGCYEFAMSRAAVEYTFVWSKYSDIEVQQLIWPMSVLRLRSRQAAQLVDAADELLNKWRGYSDEAVDIFAQTNDTPHNTVTPIARMREGVFELDLVLRNNRTSEAHPLGIFHPHAELHHIKKENIGLIEVMGLAVLPDRLQTALERLAACLRGEEQLANYLELAAHADWFAQIAPSYVMGTDAQVYLKAAIGDVFVQVLNDAGVYKRDTAGQAGFRRFLNMCCIRHDRSSNAGG